MTTAPNTTVSVEKCAPGLLWFHPPDGGEVYVVQAEDNLVLVDSGFGKHRQSLLTAMAQTEVDPHAIRLAFASHFHCDHAGDLGWWRSEYGIQVVAHEQAVEPMRTPNPNVTGSHIPYAGLDEPFVPCPVDRPVHGGESFTVRDRTFQIEQAPGHTVSGIHIVVGDLIFVGDNVFESGGIGWMDVHWGSNPDDYVETLTRLKAHCGKLACPGHGRPFLLRAETIDDAIATASFYIDPKHGYGCPRPPSQYGKKT